MEHRVSTGKYKSVTYTKGHLTCHVMTNTLEIDARGPIINEMFWITRDLDS